jgi:nitroreductase
MEFFDVLNARQSIHAYANKPVEDEKLERILEAIHGAPSAGNLQAFEVYVVTDGDDRANLGDAANGVSSGSSAHSCAACVE